jgi:dipeptidyl aminopeptidase/acylaminoacyl peptidase
MRMIRSRLLLSALLLSQPIAQAKTDKPDLATLIQAPLTPLRLANPDGTQLVLLERAATLPLSYLASPSVGLGGEEIDLRLRSSKRRNMSRHPQFFDIASQKSVPIQVPKDRNVASLSFSPGGRWLALQIDGEAGVELWIADTRSGKARLIKGLAVNDVFTDGWSWTADGQSLFIATHGSGVPQDPKLEAPTLEEAGGTKVPARTYAHLLRSPADEKLFIQLANVQWYEIRLEDGKTRKLGPPGLYTELTASPDGRHLLVKRMVPPFSYAVPAGLFAQSVEVWDRQGAERKQVLTTPLAEDLPPEGERKGPRAVNWDPDHAARLLWWEALDDGDPRRVVEHRDRLLRWESPFAGQAQEVLRLKDRVAGVQLMRKPDHRLIREFNPDTNITRVHRVVMDTIPVQTQLVLEYDVKEAYKNPGRIISQVDKRGVARVVQEGDAIFLAGDGHTAEGERPFLDRMNLESGDKQRIFSSDAAAPYVEDFGYFYRGDTQQLMLVRESPTSPPNYWLYDLKTRQSRAITKFLDNVPEMTGAKKQPLVYKRSDGLTLSGTLYLPEDYKPGQRLPAMVWAYPEEFRSAEVAGQVRVSNKRYSRPGPSGIAWLVTQGYAVLDNAAMPLIGDKETVNNSFTKQIVANAEAAIQALDQTGVVDRSRVAVGGHSYGAFMTANLLAHSQLFCAGVARSGAYNRSLTPFGFQSERRTFWEAKDFYMNVSPFYNADKMKTPLLLIHGKDDNNPGTVPMQTERMFAALRGVGATARMVLLPYESHGYRGQETITLMHEETLKWLGRWCGPKESSMSAAQ